MPADIEQLSKETLEMLKKSTNGVLYSTGLQGVDLGGFTSLVPVNVPARNNTSAFPRVIAGEGSQLALWRTWLNINATQSSAAVGTDKAGSMTKFKEKDVYAPYRPLAKAGRVTLTAVAVARNYVDALAQAELMVLNELFIAQDMSIINHQGWSIGKVTAATVTATNFTTGGSLGKTVTVKIKIAARSGANYYDGGSGAASTAVTKKTTSTTNTTHSVTFTWPALKGAVAYDIYTVHSSTYLYYTTVTTCSVTVKSLPSAAQSVPALQLISSLAPGTGATPFGTTPTAGNGKAPTSDHSYSTHYYNGIIASTLGDYGATGPVKPGTGTATGATFIDNGGAALALSGGGVSLLDTINDKLWASVQLSPTAYMVNSQQADEISRLILSSSSALTFLPPTDADARTNLAGGGYIGRYINRAAGGVPVSIEVHPRVPPGTIIARTDRVPFPGSNIGTVFEVRCQYDTMRFDYAANYNPGNVGGGPRFDFEVRSMETLVNRAPVAQAVATNVA